MEQGRREGDDRDANSSSNSNSNSNANANPRRARLAQMIPIPPPPPQRCPRCQSLHTKFCYFNNYNLGQPRYFCKACRRYWTHGGTLRNVPVGGGCRKGRKGRLPPISCGESSRSSQPFQLPSFRPPLFRPPPFRPPPLVLPRRHPCSHLPQRVTNMAGMISGISGIPSSQAENNIAWPYQRRMGSVYPGGIFTLIEGMEFFGQIQENANNPPVRDDSSTVTPDLPICPGFDFSSVRPQQALPPLQIREQQPEPAARQIDHGGDLGNRNKDKQPMYPPDEKLVLPAGTDLNNSWTRPENNNIASASNSNVWINSNGASSSSAMAESSSSPTHEWSNNDVDLPDFDPPDDE